MTGFDAELYLRRQGERALLRGEDTEWQWPVAAAAQALVAVGAIAEPEAEEVLRDYEGAEALREGEWEARMGYRSASAPAVAAPLRPRRVLACAAELESGLRVRYVALAEDETAIGVRFPAPHGSRRSRAGRRAMMRALRTPQPTIADDRGRTAGTHFSGGGGMDEWVGRLTADRPLAPDTAWIEIDGERLALERAAVTAEVAIEPLPQADPALRHLWRIALGAGGGYESESAFEPAVEALLAAGALAAGDPELAQLRRALEHGHGRRLPEPWRSLRSRGEDGPQGVLALDAMTPEFDGIVVTALLLDSDAAEWRLEVDVAPGLGIVESYSTQATRRRGLAWWAADDRGNRYRGEVGGSTGSEERARGDIEFAPALDPRATRLEIAAIGERHQALIRFPLEWT